MKLKFYSITLLLSFLVVLSHEMIPHHHHDLSLDDFSKIHSHNEGNAHRSSSDHHHHHSDDKKHSHSTNSEKQTNHSFPFHHHTYITDDFNFLRNNSIRDFVFNFHFLTVLFSFFDLSLAEPPVLSSTWFTDIPFLIRMIFEPGAVGLRAPPVVS